MRGDWRWGHVWVETRFGHDGCDGHQVEGRWDRTRAEGGVKDAGEEWSDGREAVLRSFGGVQRAEGGSGPELC